MSFAGSEMAPVRAPRSSMLTAGHDAMFYLLSRFGDQLIFGKRVRRLDAVVLYRCRKPHTSDPIKQRRMYPSNYNGMVRPSITSFQIPPNSWNLEPAYPVSLATLGHIQRSHSTMGCVQIKHPYSTRS